MNKLLYRFASVIGDMSKRILYSALLAKSDKATFYGTDGVVDQNALDYAVKGIDDILKYGIEAVKNEFLYCADDNLKKQVRNSTDPEFILNSGINNFDKLFNNSSGFGGEPWVKISKSLLKILKLKNNLNEADKQNNYDTANKIKKQIILELNYFDGLNHNTGSILDSILNQEAKKTNNQYAKNTKKIRDLMDLKNLEDTNHVFNEAIKILEEEEGIAGFSEHKHKFTERVKDNRYKEIDKNIQQLNETKFYREFSEIIDIFDSMEKNIEYYKKNIEHISSLDKIQDKYEKLRTLKDLLDMLIDFSNNVDDLRGFFTKQTLSDKFKQIYSEINKHYFSKLIEESNKASILTERIYNLNEGDNWDIMLGNILNIVNNFEKINKFGRSLFLAI